MKKDDATAPAGRQYAAPAVDSLLDIVEFLAEHPRPYGVSELSEALGLSTNMAFRVLKRLVDRGYAEMDPESQGYQLGPRFFSLGLRLGGRFELRLRARKHLEWLAREAGETCQLHVPNGDRALVLDVVNAPADFFLQVLPGSRLFYHANAFAKCFLAFSDADLTERVLAGRLERLTEHTLTRRADLEKELAAVRKTGLGYDREEYNQGIYCIGAPVFAATGLAVAGLGVTGLASRFAESARVRLETVVLQAAARVSRDIGYAGDFFKKLKAEA